MQALNRKVISTLGVSREQIHYNSSDEFHPLAELSHSENAEIDEKLDGDTLNHFERIILQRKKRLKYSRKMEAPLFAEKAIVYMRDMKPSTSNILKIPQRGPFQILDIKEKECSPS